MLIQRHVNEYLGAYFIKLVYSLVCDVFLCFVTFPCGVLGHICYLILSIPERCLLTYFVD